MSSCIIKKAHGLAVGSKNFRDNQLISDLKTYFLQYLAVAFLLHI